MYKKVFTIDGFDYVYIGYTSGRRWNGWATPYFESDEFEVWKGKDYNTTEGIKHLYGIGAYSMTWDNITNYDIENIARGIEDFIWEFDTYHYQDECIDRMQTVETIQKQLKEFNTLKQAIKIFYNDDLTEELKFEKLGGILRV